jgi:hypothetical protein
MKCFINHFSFLGAPHSPQNLSFVVLYFHPQLVQNLSKEPNTLAFIYATGTPWTFLMAPFVAILLFETVFLLWINVFVYLIVLLAWGVLASSMIG